MPIRATPELIPAPLIVVRYQRAMVTTPNVHSATGTRRDRARGTKSVTGQSGVTGAVSGSADGVGRDCRKPRRPELDAWSAARTDPMAELMGRVYGTGRTDAGAAQLMGGDKCGRPDAAEPMDGDRKRESGLTQLITSSRRCACPTAMPANMSCATCTMCTWKWSAVSFPRQGQELEAKHPGGQDLPPRHCSITTLTVARLIVNEHPEVALLNAVLLLGADICLLANSLEQGQMFSTQITEGADTPVTSNGSEVQLAHSRAVPLEVRDENEGVVDALVAVLVAFDGGVGTISADERQLGRAIHDTLGLLAPLEDGADPLETLGREGLDVWFDDGLVRLRGLVQDLARLGRVLLHVDGGRGPDELQRQVGERVGRALQKGMRGEVLLSA